FAIVLITLLAVFICTQMVDNFLFQPLIYSASIKSSPLEIFIVLLMAGHVGGIVGMLVAIPCYTVIRVIATNFFSDFKPIRRLMAATGSEQHA
ncbi:MAG TPA: AI-2E family transporter, partial [Rikenellaceae bacterium]|nr:AI-2E family transporter [Rikenellaceae bacterium]